MLATQADYPSMTGNVELLPHELRAVKERIEQVLKQLGDNLLEYNQLKNSLREPCTRYEWMDRFMKQASANGRIYSENSRLITDLMHLVETNYRTDVKEYSNDLTFVQLDALGEHNLHFFFLKQLSEFYFFNSMSHSLPFLLEHACRFFEREMVKRMPKSEFTMLNFSVHMYMDYQIAMLGDEASLHTMIKYAQKVLEFEDQYDALSCDFVRYRFLLAYYCLLYADFMESKMFPFDEMVANWQRYEAFKAKHPVHLGLTDPKYIKELEKYELVVDCFIPLLAMDFYDKLTQPDQREWLRAELRNYVDQYTETTPATYHLYVKAKKLLGDWTANEAYDIAYRYYSNLVVKPLVKNEVIEVALTFNVSKVLLHLLHATNLPEEVKLVRTAKTLEWVLNGVKNCNQRDYDFEISHVTMDFLLDKQTNELLNTELRRNFVDGVYRAALVRTYAHSKMVARISEEILHAVITFRPELLIGTMGIESVDDVPAKALALDDYIVRAANIHDVGKFSIIQIVNNNFMKLSDHEFQIIKQHPLMGTKVIDIDPSWAPFRDAVLRHHIWYNGEGGYPASEIGRKSPYDFLINILQMADALEAGSDNLGRNFSRTKTFHQLFAEMERGAGKRYNPDIIRMIRDTSSVYDALTQCIQEDWKQNYYEVYLDYFNKR